MLKKIIWLWIAVILLTACGKREKLDYIQNTMIGEQDKSAEIDNKEKVENTQKDIVGEQNKESEKSSKKEMYVEEIFPKSHIEKLEFSDMWDILSKESMEEKTQIIDKAIEEIYKRRGLDREEFIKLNDIEQFNVKILETMPKLLKKQEEAYNEKYYTSGKYVSNYTAYDANKEIFVDLDGDEIEERIFYSYDTEGILPNYLEVESVRVDDVGNRSPEQFAIIDIDIEDTYKEIAISSYGSSDDYKTTLYQYKQGELKEIDKVEGLFDYGLGIYGTGYIMSRTRANILHTWYMDVPYQLRQGSLWIVDSFYGVYEVVMTVEDLPVYTESNLDSKKTKIPAFEIITLTETDNKQWCKLETESDEVYWFCVNGFSTITDLNTHAGNVFWGLNYSD